MRKNEILLNGELTGTIGEKTTSKNRRSSQTTTDCELEFGEKFEALQDTWSVNPIDEQEYDGITGYKDA